MCVTRVMRSFRSTRLRPESEPESSPQARDQTGRFLFYLILVPAKFVPVVKIMGGRWPEAACACSPLLLLALLPLPPPAAALQPSSMHAVLTRRPTHNKTTKNVARPKRRKA